MDLGIRLDDGQLHIVMNSIIIGRRFPVMGKPYKGYENRKQRIFKVRANHYTDDHCRSMVAKQIGWTFNIEIEALAKASGYSESCIRTAASENKVEIQCETIILNGEFDILEWFWYVLDTYRDF